ncbi:hypothetical protein XENTR_v10003166 [Xenopus tropicalis]|nr:hypothetical protein XENTR_v10003166 [Xenopus tropicalis]
MCPLLGERVGNLSGSSNATAARRNPRKMPFHTKTIEGHGKETCWNILALLLPVLQAYPCVSLLFLQLVS